MPLTTEYDTKFRLLGVPVRINPFFWAAAAFMGWDGHTPLEILIWVVCVFISILIHEFGHALTTRKAFGNKPSVILYYMGGLCFSNGEENHPWKRALVIAMGPGAGFLLFGLVLVPGLLILNFADLPFYGLYERPEHFPPDWFNHLPKTVNHSIQIAYSDLLYINLFWGLVNLLPLYPLDGGQLAEVFLTMHNRYEGKVRTHAVSLVTAGLLAVYLLSKEQYPNALFVAGLGAMNFQLYQAARYQKGSYSQFDDNDDWWRK
jgi:Zn-dependent protease